MKISVIGKGTSAIISALCFIKRGYEVTIFYDPNKEHINVGESTTPHFAELINDVLGISIHEMSDYNLVSIKSGIKFIDWGEAVPFKHNFAANRIAFHFENKDLNPFIHEVLESNNLVEYIPEKVLGYQVKEKKVYINNRQFDYVVFCSGWSDEDQYEKPFFESVNTACLYARNGTDEDDLHTIHRATEDGWEFGLPFPKRGITKCGYLFNRNISNYNDVLDKLKNHKIYQTYEWTPRYSKKIIQNDYCAYNGNRLFFLEPLQAMSLYYTIFFADYICDYLEDRTVTNLYKINSMYEYTMWEYQMSIAYHYNFGSKFESDFWKQITQRASTYIESFPKTKGDNIMKNVIADIHFRNKTFYSRVGCFVSWDIKQLYCGMKNKSFAEVVNKYQDPSLK